MWITQLAKDPRGSRNERQILQPARQKQRRASESKNKLRSLPENRMVIKKGKVSKQVGARRLSENYINFHCQPGSRKVSKITYDFYAAR